ncbi:MAG: sugar transferase [Dehalococcoidia bacterium]
MTVRDRFGFSARGRRQQPVLDDQSPESGARFVSLPTRHDAYRISPRRTYAVVKRGFDIVFGLALLLLSAPVWLAAVLLIRVSSRGPVLYGQRRCGPDGRLFTCYKFRTMVAGAHDRRHELHAHHQLDGPILKLPEDPRVTRLGRWLRRSSIDELPQLLNVLRGEMSIVGPRPAIPEEVVQYSAYQSGRLAVKPGLTCLWQVSGRSTIRFEHWIELDLEYIRRRGFCYDCWLVLRTIPAVLTGKGAY